MKKTVSFNLEEDIIDKIENYQKENKLSSRSAALERIILAIDSNKSNGININDLKEIVKEIMKEANTNYNDSMDKELDKKVNELKNKDLDSSVEDIYGNME
ncbi:hypothetical protein [Clostridium tarantellae]|uniref:EF-hand domain-containing protein n=1 Tax=Clostridium tarantellae TaxID=39493 RepID=A0A6I1MKZ5_9CLOT|nr:hypothetical protein [Clostridium tarantellae]MPQ43644.1 hypothetical protein [Clostridium tarantellae]